MMRPAAARESVPEESATIPVPEREIMGSNWRRIFAGSLLALACGASVCARAEAKYPVKPIRLIAPFAPGGGATLVARLITPELSEVLGQSIVVDNRPGAGGVVGT